MEMMPTSVTMLQPFELPLKLYVVRGKRRRKWNTKRDENYESEERVNIEDKRE